MLRRIRSVSYTHLDVYKRQNQPYTEAHIIFKTKDNMEHECRFIIGHYGDYEEGIEPALENMLQSDKKLFMKKKVPVFYSPKDVNRCICLLYTS